MSMSLNMRCSSLDELARPDSPGPDADRTVDASLTGVRRINVPGDWREHSIDMAFKFSYNDDEADSPFLEAGKSYTVTIEEVTP